MNITDLKTQLKRNSIKLALGLAGLEVAWIPMKDAFGSALPDWFTHAVSAVIAVAILFVATLRQKGVATYDPTTHQVSPIFLPEPTKDTEPGQ